MTNRQELRALRSPTWISILLCVLPLLATAEEGHDHDRHQQHEKHLHGPAGRFQADTHAPIGVRGDHFHEAGEWMLSYRYMRMEMKGNRDGTTQVGVGDILGPMPDRYPVAPRSMDMQMHMIGLMYAPVKWVTIGLMIPYVELDMDHTTMSGLEFTTHSSGIGDIKLTGLVPVWNLERHQAHLNLGVSFPSGSVDHEDETPMGITRLPYPMQVGSGTYDFIIGGTYTGLADRFSWGAQVLGLIRSGENDNGWRRGDRVDLTGWLAYPWADWVSTSARMAYAHWGNIDGRDSSLNPMVVPTADSGLRSGDRIEIQGGINFLMTGGILEGHRIAIEAGAPVWQDLAGPQLETDWTLTVGVQLLF